MTIESKSSAANGNVFSLKNAVKLVINNRDKGFIGQVEALGMNPLHDLAGGDWRNTNFTKVDLRDCSFAGARLHGANFAQALVAGADFRGASDVHKARLQFAFGWREAVLDDDQIILLEARLEAQQRYKRGELSEIDWSSLIRKTDSFEDACALLAEMEAAGHPLNRFAFTSVMDKSRTPEQSLQAVALFNRFRVDGGVVDLPMLTARINLATSAEMANRIYEEILKAHMRPDERTFNALISKQRGHFEDALEIINVMWYAKVPVSKYTAFSLFDVCERFWQTVEVLCWMKRCGIEVFNAEFIYEMRDRTNIPELTDVTIGRLREDGNSPMRIVGGLIGRLIKDPKRSEYLRRLAIPDRFA